MEINQITFNAFQENTFIVWDETKECIIIDPGCYEDNEKKLLSDFITSSNLKPIKLINTHCHIDHILGNKFVAEKWNIQLHIHKEDIPLIKKAEEIAKTYGFTQYKGSPSPKYFLKEGDILKFGNSKLNVLFTPGHSPGHISLLSIEENLVISGDVLFNGSIGRTDLPGGDYNTLMKSIKTKLLCLKDNTKVFCGHGPSTTIGKERLSNPFLK